jgi:hypothetical protein
MGLMIVGGKGRSTWEENCMLVSVPHPILRQKHKNEKKNYDNKQATLPRTQLHTQTKYPGRSIKLSMKNTV